jgi:CRISPR-associated endonuclease Csn1
MKRILGLDLGTTSIGWALVEERRNDDKKLVDADIIKLGVRVNPLTVDEQTNFEKGQPISTNAERTLKRGARKNLQRFKLRREHLKQQLLKAGIIDIDTLLTEHGSGSTHETLHLRAMAAKEKVTLDQFARVLFAINKKRGYKSNRKAKNKGDGIAVDGMVVARELYENDITPGQYALSQLEDGRGYLPDFYQSDLQNEFDRIWNNQREYYPEKLTGSLYAELQGKNKSQTWAICQKPFEIVGIELTGKKDGQTKQRYQFRVNGLEQKLDLEHLAIVLQEINNDKKKSSGYLGEISDRSKELYIDKITVGEYLYRQIEKDRHTSLKRQVFYRQDYLDEFEKIWETQSKYHPKLTAGLKADIRDTVIFYQRRLKSQKGLIGHCQFESWAETRKDKEGKDILNKATGAPKVQTVGKRAIPKSSPVFQEFRIWQNINILEIEPRDKNLDVYFDFNDDAKQLLFNELNLKGGLSEKQALELLGLPAKEWKTNQPIQDRKKGTIKPIEGNRTNQALLNVYQEILQREGYGFDWAKKPTHEILDELTAVFKEIGIDPGILKFDATADGNTFEQQQSYHLWHLLYAAEDGQNVSEEDRLLYGNTDANLKKSLHHKFGFKPEYAKLVAGVTLEDGYGNLSARAIRKILPYMQAGHGYSLACEYAGYNHSKSLTKGENEQRVLKPSLENLPKNSLRNPVVEKILNQMINLINQVCNTYGKPEEIRIELARELKKSARERAEATSAISAATKQNDDIRKTIQTEYGFTPTRNDVIRYKLWKELINNGGRTIFSNRKIESKDLFSSKIDIEHIIPKAMLFDDSFSNKTLAFRDVNQAKGNRTGFDFMNEDHHGDLEEYKSRVERLYKSGSIGRAKRNKLLMPSSNLPDDFIERDLRNSQYIAKKARLLLQEVFRTVVPTSGSITDKLREDWGLINVMKELNLPKYRALGLTEMQGRWDSGQDKEKDVEVILDWTKRNDHRHHAMDALAVAFTSHNHIQYINNLNARADEGHKKHSNIIALEHLIKENGKFKPPMDNFRNVAKEHIEAILISHKAKNKVVTRNINNAKGDHKNRIQMTPRGQLHKETVYGKIKRPSNKPLKLSKKVGLEQVHLIVDPKIRQAVLAHLSKFDNNPLLAFDSKTLKKTPIMYRDKPLKYVTCFEKLFTIRKDITPENFKDEKSISKVIDPEIRKLLCERLAANGNNAKLAFSDLHKYPIWLNEKAGIDIKRVTIKGVTHAEALHNKKNHFGKEMADVQGTPIPADYVSTGNNHHVAIFKDENGDFQEEVVSFFEAVARVNEKVPIIRKVHPGHPDWEFQFTMKQNECFVLPNKRNGFIPSEIDLLDVSNAIKISPHLFRVQKFTTKYYVFRHHLETELLDKKETRSIAWERISSCNGLKGIVKVRLDHLGQIVHVGEP